MNNFKRPSPSRRGQTIDGFVKIPRQASRAGVSRGVLRRPAGSTPTRQIAYGRRIDDFRRVAPKRPVAKPVVAKPLPAPVRQSRSLPSLKMAATQTSARRSRRRTKSQALRRWSLRSAVATLAIIVGIGGFLFAQGYWNLHKAFNGSASSAALQTNVDPSKLKGEGDGRVNILLLGIGGAGHDAPDLTDTIVVASIDPINKTADLLSVPRDLWVNVPNKGAMKLNAVYETGKYEYLGEQSASNANSKAVQSGFRAADHMIEQVLGITIHYNMLLDFRAFQQAVDTVGGVDINVPEQLYDPTMAWENNWNPVLAKAGNQHFNGKHALIYVRSRETSSDFARSERQRAVMLALKDKVVSLGTLSNPLKISNLMGAFANNIHTDLSLTDAGRLYSLVKDIDNSRVKSLGLADPPNNFVTTAAVNSLSVVVPRAGFFDYSQIHKYVRSTLTDGYIQRENSRITLLNGTVTPGLASGKADELKSYGYNVGLVDNAPTSTYQDTVIVDLTHGKDKYTKHYLEQRFGVKSVATLPDATIKAGDADFIVILGINETFSSEN